MATMQAIRARIRSVTSTQQITKAMKMVAASKLRKVQGAMMSLRDFDAKGLAMLDQLLAGDTEFNNPYIEPRAEIRRVCYVLMVGNRGLCGMYNAAILHLMTDILKKETRPCDVVVCGKWGKEVFKRRRVPVVKTFDEISDTPSAEEAFQVSEYIRTNYLNGTYDEVHLVYQSYKSALAQLPADFLLLPTSFHKIMKEGEEVEAQPPKIVDPGEIIFEPDKDSFANMAIQLYISRKVQEALMEAKCCEHSARVTAMGSATDNTHKLISELQLKYNRARQEAITTEISEIVGGAAALKKKKQ